MGKIAFVGLVAGVAGETPLVGLRVADVANQLSEVVLVLDQLLAQSLKQFRVAGRVADADVVDGLDDPPAEELRPDAVGDVGGKVGVVRRGEPLGHDQAAVLALHVRLVAAEELGRHHAAADRMRHFAAARVEHDGFAVVFALLASDL